MPEPPPEQRVKYGSAPRSIEPGACIPLIIIEPMEGRRGLRPHSNDFHSRQPLPPEDLASGEAYGYAAQHLHPSAAIAQSEGDPSPAEGDQSLSAPAPRSQAEGDPSPAEGDPSLSAPAPRSQAEGDPSPAEADQPLSAPAPRSQAEGEGAPWGNDGASNTPPDTPNSLNNNQEVNDINTPLPHKKNEGPGNEASDSATPSKLE